MGAPKGHKKAGGRRKGTPNKSTTAIKAALIEAFAEMGGVPSLVTWGKKNRTEFYKLWSKLLPTEIRNADGERLRIGIVEEVVTAAVGEQNADGDADSAPVPSPAGLPPKL